MRVQGVEENLISIPGNNSNAKMEEMTTHNCNQPTGKMVRNFIMCNLEFPKLFSTGTVLLPFLFSRNACLELLQHVLK